MRRTILATMIAALFTMASANAQFVPSNNARNGRGGYGPHDGTGYQGQGPRDGAGHGAKAGKKNGMGVCDGTGPKSNQAGRRGRGGRR